MQDDADRKTSPAARPHLTAAGSDEKARRREREAQALRANLQRRKQQSRLRDGQALPQDSEPRT